MGQCSFKHDEKMSHAEHMSKWRISFATLHAHNYLCALISFTKQE